MSNLKALVKAHNNALRNLKLVMKEQNTFPKNVVYRPSIVGNNLPWLPNNYVKRLRNAQHKYHVIFNALHNALGTPPNKFVYRMAGMHGHTSNWKPLGIHGMRGGEANNVRRISRLQNASRSIQGNAATVLQKIWRGRQTRKNLTYPTPKPPVWPQMRRLAIKLGMINNTTRGYTLTPNNLKKMNFMLKRK
jgi:hypothetical protein